MSTSTSSELSGRRGRIAVRVWPNDDASFLTLIAHGINEHTGRYEHVAEQLVGDGAVVYGPDHLGHGESEGDRALVEDIEDMVADLHAVSDRARAEHPELPVVLIGHSMGALIAARYAQQHGDELSALVLSALVGGNPQIQGLLELDPMPEVPIDPSLLSRDPAVGEAYMSDPLVFNGPFQRTTLESLFSAIDAIAAGGDLGELHTLWIHGEEDGLAPVDLAREAVERIGGPRLEQKVYPGARHEVFNETNRDEVLADVSDFIRRSLAG